MKKLLICIFIFIPIISFTETTDYSIVSDTDKITATEYGVNSSSSTVERIKVFRPIKLWPLYYYNESKDEKEISILFSLHKSFIEDSYSLHLALLYHYTKLGQEKNLVIFPLLWLTTAPGYYSKVFFPFIWAKKDIQKQKKVLTIPLLLFHRSVVANRKYTICPLYVNSITDEYEFETYAFLYWYWKYPDYNLSFTVIPPMYRYQDEDKTKLGLIPLLWLTSGKQYYSYTWLLPPVWGHKNNREKTKSLNIFPIYFSSFSPENDFMTWFFLYWYSRTPEYQLKAFTLLYQYKTEDRTKYGLFPLLWYEYAKKYYSFGILPFVWGHKDETEKSESLYILPVYLYNRTTDTELRTLLFYYWYIRNPYSQTVIIPPLARYKTDTYTTDIIFPFLLESRGTGHYSFIFFPFYWKFLNYPEKFYSITLIPLFHRDYNPDTELTTILGDFWYIKNPDYMLTFSIIPPLFHHKKDEKTVGGLFPIYWATSGINWKSKVFFPFYWSGKNEVDKSEYLTLIPILFYNRKPELEYGAFGFVIPLYFYYKTPLYKLDIYGPIWNFATLQEGKKKWGFFPLYWSGASSEYRFSAFLPFYWNYKNMKEKRSTVAITLLLYYQQKSESEELKTIFPVYWYIRNVFYTKEIFTLWYRKKQGDEVSYGIFPLYNVSNKPKYNSFYFLPFIWYEHDTEWNTKKLGILPLLYYHNLQPDTELKIVTPLYWYYRDMDYKLTVCPPPIFIERKTTSDEGEVKNYGLFPLIWAHLSDYTNSFTIFPIYHGYNNYRERSYGSFLLPIWGYHKSPDLKFYMGMLLYWDYNDILSKYRLTVFLPLLYWRTVNDTKISQGVFPILWATDKPGYSSLTIFPLIWKSRNENEHSSSLILVPVFAHSVSPDEEFREYTPLYWYYRHYDETTTFLPIPLYYRKTTSEQTRTSIMLLLWFTTREKYYSYLFFPFVWGHKSEQKQTKSLNIIPLFFMSKSTYTFTSTLIPVYWYRTTPEYKFEIYTLYYHWISTDGYKRKGIFPLVWWSKKDGYSSKGFLPFYWSSKDTDEQRYSSTLVPLYTYSETINRKYKIYFPILSYFRYNKIKDVYYKYYFATLFQHKTISKRRKVFSFLWGFYRNEYDFIENKRTIDLMPFFTYEKIKRELTYFAILGKLYAYDKINQEQTFLFFITRKLK